MGIRGVWWFTHATHFVNICFYVLHIGDNNNNTHNTVNGNKASEQEETLEGRVEAPALLGSV